MSDPQSYHAARAREEMKRAAEATDERARSSHLQLAKEHRSRSQADQELAAS